ncbi:MAG: PAS domain S-box protein [Desulfobacteraceae bacterium]|jgi:PAS domain S-box-containing protein
MTQRQTYESLLRKVEELRQQSLKLMAAERAIQRQNEYLSALHETSLALLDKLDPQELLQTILERAAALAGTEHGYIFLRAGDGSRMEIQVGMGFFSDQLGLTVHKGEGLSGKVWQTGQPLLVDDYQHWPDRLDEAALDSVHSVVGIPLKQDGRVQGVIGLGQITPDKRFDQESITILERFAALALLSLEKAQLYAEVLRELAERKKAEERIRQSERRYRNFLESSPDPIVVYDMGGVATYVNPAFEQTFGMSRAEVLGKQIDFVPPEAWPETRDAIKTMLSGQKINLFETQRLTRGGKKLDVQLSSCLYMDDRGRPIGNIVTLRDITARKMAERALRNYQDQLEELVEERTTELASEVEERRRAEKALRRRETELEAQSQHLEEVNTALRVLLKQRGEDRLELQESVLGNIKELVSPYLEQVKKTRLTTRQQTFLRIIESNLDSIVSPFINRLSSRFGSFTPTEIRVANLVKEGKTNKEIGDVMSISKNTVLYHRHNIRKKLKLTNTPINLRSYLLTLEE